MSCRWVVHTATGCKKRKEVVMSINELAVILHNAYYNAPDKAKVTAVHLFGIRYSNDLRHISPDDLIKKADIPQSYHVEIRNGMNLAEYVELDKARLWFGND